MEVEAHIKAREGVGPWLLWVLPRLIHCILKRGCKTQQGWLANKPNDAPEQAVLLLSIQVCGGARRPTPGVSVGAGGTEPLAAGPRHLVCAQLLLKGKMCCLRNMGTQGNLGGSCSTQLQPDVCSGEASFSLFSSK